MWWLVRVLVLLLTLLGIVVLAALVPLRLVSLLLILGSLRPLALGLTLMLMMTPLVLPRVLRLIT